MKISPIHSQGQGRVLDGRAPKIYERYVKIIKEMLEDS